MVQGRRCAACWLTVRCCGNTLHSLHTDTPVPIRTVQQPCKRRLSRTHTTSRKWDNRMSSDVCFRSPSRRTHRRSVPEVQFDEGSQSQPFHRAPSVTWRRENHHLPSGSRRAIDEPKGTFLTQPYLTLLRQLFLCWVAATLPLLGCGNELSSQLLWQPFLRDLSDVRWLFFLRPQVRLPCGMRRTLGGLLPSCITFRRLPIKALWSSSPPTLSV